MDLRIDPDGGHYASQFTSIPNGTYEGQLVIGDSFMHPVKKFTIEKDSDIIVLQFEVTSGGRSAGGEYHQCFNSRGTSSLLSCINVYYHLQTWTAATVVTMVLVTCKRTPVTTNLPHVTHLTPTRTLPLVIAHHQDREVMQKKGAAQGIREKDIDNLVITITQVHKEWHTPFCLLEGHST